MTRAIPFLLAIITGCVTPTQEPEPATAVAKPMAQAQGSALVAPVTPAGRCMVLQHAICAKMEQCSGASRYDIEVRLEVAINCPEVTTFKAEDLGPCIEDLAKASCEGGVPASCNDIMGTLTPSTESGPATL